MNEFLKSLEQSDPRISAMFSRVFRESRPLNLAEERLFLDWSRQNPELLASLYDIFLQTYIETVSVLKKEQFYLLFVVLVFQAALAEINFEFTTHPQQQRIERWLRFESMLQVAYLGSIDEDDAGTTLVYQALFN